MKNIQFIYSLFILLMGSFLPACNNDVFIKTLKVKADTDVLGPDCRTATISVSGEKWEVTELWFKTGTIFYRGTMEGNSYSFKTSFAELNGGYTDKSITINLVSYLGNSPATVGLTVRDGYEDARVEITVNPTGDYDIQILKVDYTLNTWFGYPERDFTATVRSVELAADIVDKYTFPQPDGMPIEYNFEPFYPDDQFAARVVDCNISVPIPSYTGKGMFWEMAGEKVPLHAAPTRWTTKIMPAMPGEIDVPKDAAVRLALLCDYEGMGLDCTITAINPLTQKPEEVKCRLNLTVPVKFRTEMTVL